MKAASDAETCPLISLSSCLQSMMTAAAVICTCSILGWRMCGKQRNLLRHGLGLLAHEHGQQGAQLRLELLLLLADEKGRRQVVQVKARQDQHAALPALSARARRSSPSPSCTVQSAGPSSRKHLGREVLRWERWAGSV